MRIFMFDGQCYRFDNDADADRFAALNPDAAEMSPVEIEAAFGDNAHHVGPHNTTVAEDGTITFTWTVPSDAVLAERLREERDRRIEAVSWRVERYLSEVRQGVTPTTDDITILDAHVQALRDMPTLEGWPWGGPADPAVPWPELAEA